MDDRNLKRLCLLLIAAGIAVRLAFLVWARGTMVDDAYITLRYSHNLVVGKGFVYNEGQHVLGTTAPLYALWVAMLLRVAPAVEPGYLIGTTNIFFFAAAGLTLIGICAELGIRARIFVLMLFALFLRFVDNAILGLETPMFLLGMTGSLWLLRRRRIWALSLLLGLLPFIRPEGLFWIAAVLIVVAFLRLRPRALHFVPGIGVLLVWTIFLIVYYGSPIPQSIAAKSGWVVPHYNTFGAARIGSAFAALSLLDVPGPLRHETAMRLLGAVVLFLSLAFFIVGTLRLYRRKSILFVFPVFFVLCLASYLIGKGRVDFSWYGIPTGFAYLVATSAGLESAASAVMSETIRERLFRFLVPGVAVVLLVVSVYGWGRGRIPYLRSLRTSYEKAGEYLERNARRNARVLTAEIGMIGFTADRFMLDMGGIVSPEVMRYCAANGWRTTKCDLLREFEPDYVVFDPGHLALLDREGGAEWMGAHYEVVAEYPLHTVFRKRAP